MVSVCLIWKVHCLSFFRKWMFQRTKKSPWKVLENVPQKSLKSPWKMYVMICGNHGHGLQINVKPCKHDANWTVSSRTVKLGTYTTYDKRTNPIDFQGHGSKVKVTRYTLLLNLVNMIQTEPFQLGPSNLVHILLMTRGLTLLIFKVMGQRSRSRASHCS